MVLKYQDLVTKPYETVRRVHQFMGVTRRQKLQQTATTTVDAERRALTQPSLRGRSVSSELLINQLIWSVIRESDKAPGATAGIEASKLVGSDRPDTGIVRSKVDCGTCKPQALAAIADAPTCVSLLEELPLLCCGDHVE